MTNTDNSIDHICPRSTYCCITVNCGMLPTTETCAPGKSLRASACKSFISFSASLEL